MLRSVIRLVVFMLDHPRSTKCSLSAFLFGTNRRFSDKLQVRVMFLPALCSLVPGGISCPLKGFRN